jgi:hypothetical protein
MRFEPFSIGGAFRMEVERNARRGAVRGTIPKWDADHPDFNCQAFEAELACRVGAGR